MPPLNGNAASVLLCLAVHVLPFGSICLVEVILLDDYPERTANLSPSVESVAGSTRAEGSVYLQRLPLAFS